MVENPGVPVSMPPAGASSGAHAELPPASPAGQGMFGIQGSGDTSGYGLLVRRHAAVTDTPRPYGGYFGHVYDALAEAFPGLDGAIERVVVDRDELTLHIVPERIAEVYRAMRDDDALRFALCASLSAVADPG